MADSDVVRARRRRQHVRGDHRECGSTCTAKRAAAAAAVPQQSTVTAAVDLFAEAVGAWPEDDPRRIELALARLLASRLDNAEGDWRSGEYLVGLMRTLAVDPEQPADVVDEIRAKGAAKEIERLTRTAPAQVQPATHWVR